LKTVQQLLFGDCEFHVGLNIVLSERKKTLILWAVDKPKDLRCQGRLNKLRKV
jgi:hypothetical protein